MISHRRWRRTAWGLDGDERSRPSRPRAAFHVESLEPRFLLNATHLNQALPARPASIDTAKLATGTATVARPDSSKGQPAPVPSTVIEITAPGLAATTVSSVHAVNSAVDVPTVASPAVVDVLSSVDAGNSYHVSLDARTTALELDLHGTPATTPETNQLSVVDETGKPVGKAEPSSDPTSVRWKVSSTEMSPGSKKLVVRINRGDSAQQPSNPLDSPPNFDLRITRQGESESSTAPLGGTAPAPDSGPSAPLSAIVSLVVPPPATTLEGSPSSDESEPPAVQVSALPVPASQTIALPGSVPTGPLPVRSAAPLGGILAEGDPIPQADRRDALLIDLDLIGVLVDAPVAPRRGLLDSKSEFETEMEPDRLELVRGAGGFPVLASLAIGVPGGRIASPAREGARSEMAPIPEVAVAPIEVAPLRDRPTGVSAGTESRRTYRISVGSLLVFTVSIVFSLVLPDFALGIPSLENPRGRRRLRVEMNARHGNRWRREGRAGSAAIPLAGPSTHGHNRRPDRSPSELRTGAAPACF